MAYDPLKLTEFYLALWKLLDIGFPSHHWLELSSESAEGIEAEIERMVGRPVARITENDLTWGDDPRNLQKDLSDTVQLAREAIKSADWIAKADTLRSSLRDKALYYAQFVSEAYRRNLASHEATLTIPREPGPTFFVGEALVGDGDELAHVDLIIGSKQGHAGRAFCNALCNNSDGFTKLLAIVSPNLPAKPDTLLFNKVTIKNARQAVQMFGPAQAAVARAVVDSVSSGVIPRDNVDDYCALVGVFIHWHAKDAKKIFEFNYEATKKAIERALRSQPDVDAVITQTKTALHPMAKEVERWR